MYNPYSTRIHAVNVKVFTIICWIAFAVLALITYMYYSQMVALSSTCSGLALWTTDCYSLDLHTLAYFSVGFGMTIACLVGAVILQVWLLIVYFANRDESNPR